MCVFKCLFRVSHASYENITVHEVDHANRKGNTLHCCEAVVFILSNRFKVKISRYTKNRVFFSVPCVYVREDVREDVFCSVSSIFTASFHCSFRFRFPVFSSSAPSPPFRFGFPYDYPAAVPGRFFPGFSRKRS